MKIRKKKRTNKELKAMIERAKKRTLRYLRKAYLKELPWLYKRLKRSIISFGLYRITSPAMRAAHHQIRINNRKNRNKRMLSENWEKKEYWYEK